MSLKHFILKSYWTLKVPYTNGEIQKGICDVDVWLCSPGGSGSNMLKDFLHNHLRVKSPQMAGLLTHHAAPVDCHKPNFKAIYLHRHPIAAVASMKRRKLIKTNIRKLNNSKKLPATESVLLESVLRQFKNWTTRQVNYPILCVKYESLFDYKDELGEFLGIDMRGFPEKKNTPARMQADHDESSRFRDQIRDWESFPDFLIRYPRQ